VKTIKHGPCFESGFRNGTRFSPLALTHAHPPGTVVHLQHLLRKLNDALTAHMEIVNRLAAVAGTNQCAVFSELGREASETRPARCDITARKSLAQIVPSCRTDHPVPPLVHRCSSGRGFGLQAAWQNVPHWYSP
jgi:hypothetical protein